MTAKRKSKHTQPERAKTRKELRKEKRQQKKAQRVHYHQKKKELKLEYRARLKEKNQQKQGKPKKNETENPDDFEKVIGNRTGSEEDDEEILSDFELSDDEMESKFARKSLNPKVPQPPVDKLTEDLQREKQKQKKLEREMVKQRVRQLKMANEDEDKMIRKLEKQLKLDKRRKSDKKVPKMFNDGLDYALEMCLPENIEKMYAAAKEAAEIDDSDGFEEDLTLATGGTQSPQKAVKRKNESRENEGADPKDKKQKVELEEMKRTKRISRLRKIESKYFESDDELVSDMSDVDSEFELDHVENGKESGSDDMAEEEEEDDEDENDDSQESNADDDTDDDAPLEVPISRKKVQNPSKLKTKEEKPLPGKFVKASIETDTSEIEDYDSEEFSDDEEDDGNSKKTSDITKPLEWEDIYGRLRNKDGEILDENEKETKYIPPHVRARIVAETGAVDAKRKEKLDRLRKQLKGYLNRLSESNMHKISTDIESLYMQNSRFDMNNTLTTLILESLVSNVLANERMVLEHTLLIAALHGNVGSEIGAHFLQTCITKFDEMMKHINEHDVENKELDNMIFIICHMYTFKIFQHTIIYEILNRLTNDFTEKSIECILLILKSVGFALRKDDPVVLKDLIINLQRKSNESVAELKNNPRCKFMLDVLLAVKNNNVNKIPQYDPTLAEHLRKILKSLLMNGKSVATLNITLEDLLRADQRGKWWVVGSAWSGSVKDIGGATSIDSKKPNQQKFSDQLLELARKQRMNTEDRRNVFCILMSAEDYIEAFEKLLQLNIKDQKVIVTVVIHCCLSEKTFNPYYAVLIQKFCDYDRKYQLAVQFAIWDRIKDIKTLSNVQIRNMAQFLLYLFENGGLPLSILKIVEFGELDKSTMRLVRQIMLGLLLGKEDTCKQVFERIAPSTKLKVFKDSLRLFMHHFLVQGAMKSGISEEQIRLLKIRIQIADKSLETYGSKLKF